MFASWTERDSTGSTPIHKLARSGRLNQVPEYLLVQRNLMLQDNDGKTPLYEAAYNGHLEQMPFEVLTSENMLLRTKSGDSALHSAARAGQLDKVPVSMLTVENLLVQYVFEETRPNWPPINKYLENGHSDLKESGVWRTPLYWVVLNGVLDQIPLGLEFPETVKILVGDEWWERNQAVLNKKAELGTSTESVEVELF